MVPGLCPRLLQIHLHDAVRVAAGLHATVLPLLQDALDKFTRVRGEAWDLAARGGGAAQEDAAALLDVLHEALVVRTCARVRCAAQFSGLTLTADLVARGETDLPKEAQAWVTLAQEWEMGALVHAKEFKDMEEGVWRATAGGASLRALCEAA